MSQPNVSFTVVCNEDGTITVTSGDRSETVKPYEGDKFRVPEWVWNPDA